MASRSRRQGAGTRASASSPIRSLLKQRAYTQIKEGILKGIFSPSSFLSERQLAHQLEMSKTPIRAALERLESEGLVATSPQQGIVVRDFSAQEIADLYEMREALETYAARTLAGRLTAGQIERVEACLQEQADVFSGGDIPRIVALDAAFHLLVCEFLGNREILRIMEQLRDKIFRVISRVFQINPARIQSSYAEHEAIVQALVRGKGDLAAQRVVEHLERGKQYLLSPRK